MFDEKETSICKVIEDYYNRTYKNISRYIPKLLLLVGKGIDEISIVGHSLAGVDIPYSKSVDEFTDRVAKWKVYYHRDSKKQRMFDSLIDCGINIERIKMLNSNSFYNIEG